jgi:hypothetical protein
MSNWTGRITVTIEVDDIFEADDQQAAEEYIEFNWTDYLHRSTVESVDVEEIEDEEEEEESTNIPGIEE